jgi:hypothetical protein
LNTLIASWSPPNPQGDDYAVATSGQLKHVTRLFFQRLEDERLARFPNWPSNLPPWFQASPVSDDFAPINLGQLKAAFAILEGKGFSQAVSSNSLASLSSSQFGLGWFKDSDADSFADIAELTQNGHPTNPLIQPVPTLRILSGNRQLIPPATIAPATLRVIAERGWIPQPGLSVTFNALAGLTSTTQVGPWLPSQTITTAPDGTAQIHWQSGSTAAPDEVTVTLPPPSGPPIVFGLNPPIGPPGGGGNGPGNPPPPVSPPPPTFHVFTSIRIKNASFSGATGTECREDTDTTETWIEGDYARSTPRPTDDGFDGDADLNQNPSDPGDPRDLNLQHLANTSANVIEKGVDPDSPGAYPLEPYMEESVVNLGTYSPFTLPNKGYYSADDAFLSTPPSTQEGSPTYTSGVLTSMLAATPWGPNLHSGWMGNGRNGISSQSASAFWYSYTWSGSCGTPEPPVDPPEDPPTDPEGEPCCGGSSTSSGGTVTTVSGSGTSVGANHTQVRLQCSHTVTDPAGISRTFLLIQTRTNFTTNGQISGDPVVTVLGTATLTIPQGQKISTQVSGSASLTYLRNLGGIAYVEMAPPPSTPNTRIELDLKPMGLTEVTFAGTSYHQLQSDKADVIYDAPHWVDANGNGTATRTGGERNYPVAFTRNTKPHIGVKFYAPVLPQAQVIEIKASSAQGLQLPPTSVQPAADGSITLQPTPVSNNLSNSIQFHNADDNTAFKIDWEIRIANTAWASIGSTKHTVYITMADPIETAINLKNETLFNLGCRNAKGLGSSAQAVVDAIYKDFQDDRDVQRVKPSSAELDGKPLQYWGKGLPTADTTQGLLNLADGQCGAWGKFFIDVLRTQGIDATLIQLKPDIALDLIAFQTAFSAAFGISNAGANIENTPAIFVRDWKYEETRPPLPNQNLSPFHWVEDDGIKAQGNDNPICRFADHAIVQFNSFYYDPSYGATRSNSLEQYEDKALMGEGFIVREALIPSNAWFAKMNRTGTKDLRDAPLPY